jgi:flagellar biosynthesis/type III secretory pathway chaperone
MDDSKVLNHIKKLVEEEERLYSKGKLEDREANRLNKMKVELDQCWDLLRQRRALREAGKNPEAAKVRPPDIVENYEQ